MSNEFCLENNAIADQCVIEANRINQQLDILKEESDEWKEKNKKLTDELNELIAERDELQVAENEVILSNGDVVDCHDIAPFRNWGTCTYGGRDGQQRIAHEDGARFVGNINAGLCGTPKPDNPTLHMKGCIETEITEEAKACTAIGYNRCKIGDWPNSLPPINDYAKDVKNTELLQEYKDLTALIKEKKAEIKAWKAKKPEDVSQTNMEVSCQACKQCANFENIKAGNDININIKQTCEFENGQKSCTMVGQNGEPEIYYYMGEETPSVCENVSLCQDIYGNVLAYQGENRPAACRIKNCLGRDGKFHKYMHDGEKPQICKEWRTCDGYDGETYGYVTEKPRECRVTKKSCRGRDGKDHPYLSDEARPAICADAYTEQTSDDENDNDENNADDTSIEEEKYSNMKIFIIVFIVLIILIAISAIIITFAVR